MWCRILPFSLLVTCAPSSDFKLFTGSTVSEISLPSQFEKMKPYDAAHAWAQKAMREKVSDSKLTIGKRKSLLREGEIIYNRTSGGGDRWSWQKFGEQPQLVRFSASYPNRYWRSLGSFSPAISLEVVPLGKRANHYAQAVSCLPDLKVVREKGGSAITRDSISTSPPIRFYPYEVYNSRGKLHYKDPDFVFDETQWGPVAEGLLTKLEPKVEESSWIDLFVHSSAREGLILRMRGLLGDRDTPIKLKTTLVYAVAELSISEMLPDLRSLSRTTARRAAYRYEYDRLSKVMGELSWDEQARHPKHKRYSELLSRSVNDHEQNLRDALDDGIEVLSCVGSENKIRSRFHRKKHVASLMYHLYRTNKPVWQKLTIERLAIEEGASSRYRLIADLKEAAPETLLKYLSTCSERLFIRCSADAAELIRRERPEWKLKLQNALVKYHTVVGDDGRWPMNGIEALVPEDAPRYFDEKVVGDLLARLEKNPEQFAYGYYSMKDVLYDLAKIRARWEGKAVPGRSSIPDLDPKVYNITGDFESGILPTYNPKN